MAFEKVTDWATGADGAFPVWATETRHPRPSPYPRHRHRVNEITLILAGRGLLRWGRETQTHSLEAGSLFITLPGEPHQLLDGPVTLLHRITIFFTRDALPPALTRVLPAMLKSQRNQGPLSLGGRADLADLMTRARSLVALTGKPGEEPFLSAQFSMWFALIHRARQISNMAPDTPALKRLITWLDARGNQPFEDESLDQAARRVALGRRQFTRLFRQHMGESFHHWQLMRRLSAVDTCIDRGMPVGRAALEGRFDSLPHFFRIYKKYRGHSPARRGPA